jgi:GNAT superfamily N-acetyltransferase
MSGETQTPVWTVAVARQASDLAGFESMTFPAYAPLLQRVGLDPLVVAVVARAGNEPAGLALAQLHPETSRALVRSLFTSPTLRRRGIAAALLARLESFARELGTNRITASYATNPAVDALLTRANWEEPEPSMYLFRAARSALETLEQAPFLRETVLAPGQEIVPWGDLSADDRTAIDASVVRWNVPGGLAPASDAARLDPSLSLVLRIDGEIYAWLLIHRTGPERVRYSALYARPDCPVKGLGVRLLVEALRRHVAQVRAVPDADATWGCHADMPMAGFCLRRILPHLPGTIVTETWMSGKDLGTTPA